MNYVGHLGKSMVKLDVLTHEIKNSGHIIQNNVINCQCLIGPCYPVPANENEVRVVYLCGDV